VAPAGGLERGEDRLPDRRSPWRVASVPKVVQEAVGHSTIAVTLDLYSHVVPSLQRETAKEMGAALFG
jgi:integrase